MSLGLGIKGGMRIRIRVGICIAVGINIGVCIGGDMRRKQTRGSVLAQIYCESILL